MSIIQQVSSLFQDLFNNLSNSNLIFLANQAKKVNSLINDLQSELKKLSDTNNKLNNTIKSLKKEIKILKGEDIDNTPIDSISPKYNPSEVGLPPVLKSSLKLNFNDILKVKSIKPSTQKAIDKLVNPEQICPNCSSDKTYHCMHTKKQKMCKCCLKTFSIKDNNNPIKDNLCCPHCYRTLDFRVSRNSFDVFVCKNKKCPYRVNHLSNKGTNHPCDKISYIYRRFNLDFNTLLEHINNSIVTKISLNFRKFNLDILSKVLFFKVNLRLSNRLASIALKDLFDISISHTTIATYCQICSKIISVFNANYKFKPSNQLVADETYIKVKGKKHYVWIIYDLVNSVILSYKISSKRDTAACIEAITKAIKCYGDDLPEEINFSSDMFTAYPLALQTIAPHFNIKFNHKTVKGLKVEDGEDSEARRSKQIIERLNRVFKESYRVTTGYGTLDGAIDSFELWMFYYNFLRVDYGSRNPKRSLSFINKSFNVDNDYYMPNKWLFTIFYTRDNFVELSS